jgi:hypothetical protein
MEGAPVPSVTIRLDAMEEEECKDSYDVGFDPRSPPSKLEAPKCSIVKCSADRPCGLALIPWCCRGGPGQRYGGVFVRE